MGKIFDYINKHPMSIMLACVLVLAGVGIFCAILAHYLAHPFSWIWFLCLDCPLYAFMIWVFCKISPWINQIIEDEHKKS
jgi:hypothetical protein